MNGGSNIKKERNNITVTVYFQFVSLVLLFTGLGMFIFCSLERVHPMDVQVLSSPVHYLVLGIVCFVVFFVCRFKDNKLK